MNLKSLYYPSVRMGQALKESRDLGQSRIEITFTATSKEGEDEILHPVFYERAKIELDRAERALDSVKGLGWHLPLHELLTTFSEVTKQNQLFILLPTLVAIVYAVNSKTSCYTGFCQVTTPSNRFDYLDFLAAQALPGPGSFITCVLQHQGTSGPTQYLVLEKKTAIA